MDGRIYTDVEGDTVELQRQINSAWCAWIKSNGEYGVYLSRKQCLDLAAQLTAIAGEARDDVKSISGVDFTK